MVTNLLNRNIANQQSHPLINDLDIGLAQTINDLKGIEDSTQLLKIVDTNFLQLMMLIRFVKMEGVGVEMPPVDVTPPVVERDVVQSSVEIDEVTQNPQLEKLEVNEVKRASSQKLQKLESLNSNQGSNSNSTPNQGCKMQ